MGQPRPNIMDREGSVDFYLALGQRMKEARNRLGLSQEEVGAHLGLQESAIGAIESALQTLSAWRVVELSKILQVSPGFLLGYEDQENLGEKVIEKVRVEFARVIMEDVQFRQLILAQKMKDALDKTEDELKSGKV